jgi:hypothetical protein
MSSTVTESLFGTVADFGAATAASAEAGAETGFETDDSLDSKDVAATDFVEDFIISL